MHFIAGTVEHGRILRCTRSTWKESATKNLKDYRQLAEHGRVRHTIQVFDGCAGEIAEFETKEDRLLVICAGFKGMEQDMQVCNAEIRDMQEGIVTGHV